MNNQTPEFEKIKKSLQKAIELGEDYRNENPDTPNPWFKVCIKLKSKLEDMI